MGARATLPGWTCAALALLSSCREHHLPRTGPPIDKPAAVEPRPDQAAVAQSEIDACPGATARLADAMVERARRQLEELRRLSHPRRERPWPVGAAPGLGASGAGGGPGAEALRHGPLFGQPLEVRDDSRELLLSEHHLFTARSLPWAPAASLALPASQEDRALLASDTRVAAIGSRFDSASGRTITVVSVVDVSALDAPSTLGRYELPGDLLDAKAEGPQLRLLTTLGLAGVPSVDGYAPRPNLTPAQRDAELDALFRQSASAIRRRSLQQWLGAAVFFTAGGGAQSFPARCAEVGPEPGQPPQTNLYRLDLERPGSLERHAALDSAPAFPPLRRCETLRDVSSKWAASPAPAGQCWR